MADISRLLQEKEFSLSLPTARTPTTSWLRKRRGAWPKRGHTTKKPCGRGSGLSVARCSNKEWGISGVFWRHGLTCMRGPGWPNASGGWERRRKQRVPRHLPDYIGWDDEWEARAYAADALDLWRGTKGARGWLLRAQQRLA